MGELVACYSRRHLGRAILFAALFVLMGLWMSGVLGEPPKSRRYSADFTVAMGWVCIVLFALGGMAIVRKMFDASEQLVIGPSGIYLKSWSDRTIPWSEIREVTTWEFKKQTTLTLHLWDRSRVPGRKPAAIMAGANRMLVKGDVSVQLTPLNRSPAEILHAIQRFRPCRY